MIKIITTIIAVYLLYYAGNIVYDLFIKKDNSVKKDDSEEYSLTEFSQDNKNEVQKIEIDDVENINTPNSFNKKELFSTNQEEQQDESRDLAYFRTKFESEQDIDDFTIDSEVPEKSKEKVQEEIADLDSNQEGSRQDKEKTEAKLSKVNSYHLQFKNFLNLAETSVQVLSDRDGL